MLLPSSLYTTYKGASGRCLSPNIWTKAARSKMQPDGSDPAVFLEDDFHAFGIGTAVSSNVAYYVGKYPYYSFEDTGGAIAQLATERNGVVSMSVDADDNQECWLQLGNATSVNCVISDTAGADKLLAFEARFRATDVVGNRFLGLAEAGMAAGDFITDAGAMIDKDWIGFFTLEGAPTALKFGWKKEGQTVVSLFTVGTIAAATWYKVGFLYDPDAPEAKRIKIFLDNVEAGTYGTATHIATATFPDGEELSPIFGVKNVTDIMVQDLDWFALYQAG